MNPTEMEDAIKSCDHRLSTIEQILPTLATKQDLERFATKQDLERFATKQDLEGFATKEDLREGIADARRHADILVEDVRDDIRKVAEAVALLAVKVDANTTVLGQMSQRLESVTMRMDTLTTRLEAKGVI